MSKSLQGIRICDLTRILAGPYCTMVLGDMGAEVLKIERPNVGDDTRTYGPPFVNGHSYYFLSINRNKKSLAVDITKKQGREIVLQIAEKSDVLIENFAPGKLDSLSLSYEDIHEVNPGIIYCSITGYGSRGEDKMKPGYDVIASAIGGGMHLTGEKDGRPMRHGIATTDILTGLYAHSAIIASLYKRLETGKGKKIDCSLLQSQIASLHSHASSYLNANEKSDRMGTQHPNVAPYQAFEASDGMFVIGAGNDKHFKNLCKALEMEELLKDERFRSNPLRVKNRDILSDIIQKRVETGTKTYWIELLEAVHVPCGPVNDIGETFDTPTVKQYLYAFDHPQFEHVRLPGPAVEFDNAIDSKTPLPPPMLGEHTEEVLKNLLKYDDKRIQDLMQSKIIHTALS